MVESLIRLLLLLINIAEFILFTLFLYLLSYLPFVSGSNLYFVLFRFWCRSFQRALGIKVFIHQKNTLRLPDRYILIANHPSAFEDIGIPGLYPVHSLAKIEVKEWFIVGRISRAAGTLYVDREDKESRRQAIDMMSEAVAEGKNVALYPEGGCTGRRITKDFKYGAFELSLKTGVPVLPVLIYYQSQDDFEWQPPYNLVDMIWHFLTTQNKRVDVYQFDLFNPEDFKDKADFSQQVQAFYHQQQAKYLE